MPEGPVVLNNTPLVALWVLGRLDLLRDLYSEVSIPEVVRDEFLAVDTTTRQAVLENTPWIKTMSLTNPHTVVAYPGLDRGEAAVLALAEEQNARLVVMDERKGRRYARELGLPLTGTLGVLLLAKERGLIPALAPLVTRLQQAGLRLSEAVISKALYLAGESDL